MSWTESVTVPFTLDATVKFPWPFCTEKVWGDEPPFMVALESPDDIETLIVSFETAF